MRRKGILIWTAVFGMIICVSLAFDFIHVQKTHVVDAENEVRELKIAPFTQLNVSMGVKVKLVCSTENKIVLVNHPEDLLVVDQKDEVLSLSQKERATKRRSGIVINIDKQEAISLIVYYTEDIDMFNVDSGGEIVSKDIFKAPNLDFYASSGGVLVMKAQTENAVVIASSGGKIKLDVVAINMEIEASSGADVVLQGEIASVKARASSGASLNAKEIQIPTVFVSVSSSADCSFTCCEVLHCRASSGSDVHIYGNPHAIFATASSSASVRLHVEEPATFFVDTSSGGEVKLKS